MKFEVFFKIILRFSFEILGFVIRYGMKFLGNLFGFFLEICPEISEYFRKFYGMFSNVGICFKSNRKNLTTRNFDRPNFWDRNTCGGAVCTTCPTTDYATESYRQVTVIHRMDQWLECGCK